jgi:endonuclease/exonuclease/phosphatase family metal-dependent hydrolase
MLALALLCVPLAAAAQTITVATYNVEHFADHFEAHRLSTQPIARDEQTKPLVDALRKSNDENNWEVAQVILDPKFSPDVLVIEEGCDQGDLDYFNKRWLNEAYEAVVVFKTNTDRHQNLCMLLKKGFKIVERKDDYYKENDTIPNSRGNKLFARGPAFAVVQTPSGYKFWVGVTHQKSKAGSDDPQVAKDSTEWRNREAIRTHQIMLDLAKQGPADVMLLGDMNDDLGVDQVETSAGGDTIANLVGPPADGFILATKPLADAKQNSFGGYWNTKFRSLIDHIVITPSMKDRVEDVQIFKEGLAPVASDHYPVYAKVKTK